MDQQPVAYGGSGDPERSTRGDSQLQAARRIGEIDGGARLLAARRRERAQRRRVAGGGSHRPELARRLGKAGSVRRLHAPLAAQREREE